MKVAKFEIKMILALFLSRYNYKLVDGTGQPPKQLPQPNRNDFRQVCIHLYLCIFRNTKSESVGGSTVETVATMLP
jgi:hypothetical protein